jgi:hypothetical protein
MEIFCQTAIVDQNAEVHKHLDTTTKAIKKTNQISGSSTLNRKLTSMQRSSSCNISETTPLFVSMTGRQSVTSLFDMSSFTGSQRMMKQQQHELHHSIIINIKTNTPFDFKLLYGMLVRWIWSKGVYQ